MNCLKCGREIEDNQVFCPKCLKFMESSPVRHDVVVKLPDRQAAPPKRPAPHRKARTPEEQIAQLKRKNRWLTAAVALLLAGSMFLAYLSIDFFRQLDVQRFLGKNYSTVETTD